jgi:hypothetical protein
VREYAALFAAEIIDQGFVSFAEGNSVPHGSGSNYVAGGNPVPGFLAYLRNTAPREDAGKLDQFDEIYERFVDLTATVEAATGPGGNAAHNRASNAANEIFDSYFRERTDDTVRQLHDGFGDASTPVDMSKVSIGAATGGGCLIASLTATGAMVLATIAR